jgi:cell division protein FtsN
MFRWRILAVALVPCGATLAAAQGIVHPIDPVFVRAQTMVSDGNGAAGRALVDSVLKATPPYAPLYPVALFWRASLASNAADAESDYKHIVVDYPLAPQAEDALLRLAQLELARGDRDAALSHLQRIPRDYPRSKSLARASYWTARVLFEKNDVPNACAANASALAQATTDEIELRNQIQYQGQRCPSAPVSVAAANPPALDPVAGASAPAMTSPSATSTPISASSTPAVHPSGDVGSATTAPQTKPTSVPTQSKPMVAAPVAAVPTRQEKVQPPTAAKDATPSIVVPPKTSPAPTPAKATLATGGYSVQVAAYNHRSDAEKLAATLVQRGYQARVDGDVLPFRVRIGLYATENDAESALKRIKAKHMDGFVARVPAR